MLRPPSPVGCQLQARWEQRDAGCPPPSAAPAGGEAAIGHDDGGLEPPEPFRESAPVHDGDKENKVGVVVIKPGGTAATSACVPSNGSVGPDDGSDGGCGESAAMGGEGGAGEVGPSATKSEEYLLEAAGSMVEGLGGDLEGDEVRREMFGAVLPRGL